MLLGIQRHYIIPRQGGGGIKCVFVPRPPTLTEYFRKIDLSPFRKKNIAGIFDYFRWVASILMRIVAFMYNHHPAKGKYFSQNLSLSVKLASRSAMRDHPRPDNNISRYINLNSTFIWDISLKQTSVTLNPHTAENDWKKTNIGFLRAGCLDRVPYGRFG